MIVINDVNDYFRIIISSYTYVNGEYYFEIGCFPTKFTSLITSSRTTEHWLMQPVPVRAIQSFNVADNLHPVSVESSKFKVSNG